MDESKHAKLASLFEANRPLFTALGNEHRQRLLLLIMDGKPRSVRELADGADISRPTISHHLKILKETGILAEMKVGTRTFYQPRYSEYFDTLHELVTYVGALQRENKQ